MLLIVILILIKNSSLNATIHKLGSVVACKVFLEAKKCFSFKKLGLLAFKILDLFLFQIIPSVLWYQERLLY